MIHNTLVSLFESNKSELAEKLNGMSLPKDSDNIQVVVCDYLNSLFDKDGEFRMSLTQAEDYILNAALQLLSAQREIGAAVKTSSAESSDEESELNRETSNEQSDSPKAKLGVVDSNPFLNKTVNAPVTVAGAGGGALVGHVVGGSWGSVFGAIAGTAVAIYMSSVKERKAPHLTKTEPKVLLVSTPIELVCSIDVEQFLDITKRICEGVDNLIATFRAQVRRVIDKYENQEKPSIEKEYSLLLESIQTLIGYKRAHSEDEKYVKKVSERIEDLAEQVENYNLQIVDYDGNNSQYFSEVPSSKTDIKKQAFPAVVKNGSVVLKGKVFIPETIE